MQPTLLKYPYPYHAMLAICSDLDETTSWHEYFELVRFFNTDEMTQFGQGLNLEVGNTLYFSMPEGNCCYFNATHDEKSYIHQLLASGHIDCLHSFGDLVQTKEEVAQALSSLSALSVRPRVWVDHAQAKTNLDTGIMQGQGACRSSESYHFEHSLDLGVLDYVWLGRVTSVVGQHTEFKVLKSWHSLFRTHFMMMLKEVSKILLGKLGVKKYALHQDNQLFHIRSINGTECIEFIRANGSANGPGADATLDGLKATLTPNYLDALIAHQGVSILYTHLGKYNPKNPLSDEAKKHFAYLKSLVVNQSILVTTTSRLLDYVVVREQVVLKSRYEQGCWHIDLNVPNERIHHCQGLSVLIPKGEPATFTLNGTSLLMARQKTAHGDVHSLPWQPLVLPKWQPEVKHA